MIFKSLRFTEGFFVRLGRDHLRVVRAGLVLGAIGGCNYEGEQGRGSKGGSKGQAYEESKRRARDRLMRGEQGTGL